MFKLIEDSLLVSWSFDWSKISVPTLVMTGHFDRMFRIPEDIENLVKTIKNPVIIEYSSCGHLIPMEEPELFANNIIKFTKNLN